MAYTIPKVKPFVIKGEKGEYLIPAFSTLSVDDVSEVMGLRPETPVAERVEATKKFLLKFAPELECEQLGDVGYSMIFAAYEKEQNLGK